jgi:beta-galactosidase/beta-glucuronidase
MDRRTFVGSLGALYLASHANLLGEATMLNDNTACASPGDETVVPQLVPIPTSTHSIQNPVVNLAGEWKFAANPPTDFWKPALDTSVWSSLQMPNEFATQGFEIAPNTEYPCRRTISIPEDFHGQRIFLRFDGVYGYARVWINGVYLRDHFGGFTSWDCEITDHVKPGEDADLVLGITDRDDDISQASYYAKHSIAGILRDVRLFALPRTCLSALNLAADFDSENEIGGIDLSAQVSQLNAGSAVFSLTLKDQLGDIVPLESDSLSLTPGKPSVSKKITVPAPNPWDAEHPNLYTLKVSLLLKNEVVETLERKIGFRSVRRQGNQLLVNGRPVKLRGVCRHSIHPIHGRATPPKFDEMDATLLRAANINFVRTSHYPPTEQFLEACDRHGIYVEEETAVCWSNSEKGPSSSPEFRGRFLSQFEEMINRDRGHASVLFWSQGNESQWGSNFAAERQLAHELDPHRPMIFSYPDTAPAGTDAFGRQSGE